MSTSRKPRRSSSSRTISTPMPPHPSTKPFPPPRLVERFEWHYTPKHGSWLDLAESELGALASQCLDRRIPDKKTITDEVAAWVRERNKNHAGAEWHFSTDDARIKLRSLYPST